MPDFGVLYQNYDFDGDKSINMFAGFLSIDGERLMVTLGYPRDMTMMILRHDSTWSDYFCTLNMNVDPRKKQNKGIERFNAELNFHGNNYLISLELAETEFSETCVIIRAKKVKKSRV